MIVAFRRHTLLPLDDCRTRLSRRFHLTRSSLHRCLQRHRVRGWPRSKARPRPAKVQGLSDRLFPWEQRLIL